MSASSLASGTDRTLDLSSTWIAMWRRDAVEKTGSDADVGNVAGRQDEGERFAFSIGHSVGLAGPPAT
jgi:hypothetical protein